MRTRLWTEMAALFLLLGTVSCGGDREIRSDGSGTDSATQDAAKIDLPRVEGGSKKDKNQADLKKGNACSKWANWTDLTKQYTYTCIRGCGGKYIRCTSSGSSAGCWCASGPGIIPRPGDSGLPWLVMCSHSISPGPGACKEAFLDGCCN